MKIITNKETDTIDVSKVTDDHFVVGKDINGRPLMIFPIEYDSKYCKAVLIKQNNFNGYFGHGNLPIRKLIKSLPFEFHAFTEWKEALLWLINNCE
jgi:hypothetical protein